MDINQIYSIVKFISNKNQSGYITPEEFNNSINLAQKQYFHQLLEDVKGWDANRKRVRLPMGNAQQSIEKLAPFILSVPTGVQPNGQLPKAGNEASLLAIRTSDNETRVWRVEHDRVASHLSSVVDPVSDSPIYTEYGNYYQVYPTDIAAVVVDYLYDPTDAKWAYTIVANRPEYDAANSLQLRWKDTEVTEIIIRVLFMFGISIQASQLVQYYGSIKSDGQ